MSLVGSDPFYFTSLLNEEQISSTSINYTGLTTNTVIGYDGTTLTSNITTDGLAEGFSNLYFTTSRSRAAVSGGSGISYSSSTGVIDNIGIITLTGGTGITIGSGSNPTVTNVGIITLTGGTGITIGSGSNPTVTNVGIITLTGGTGITIGSGSNPTIANTGVLSLTGTANRITVSGSTGNITITCPQDIATSSSPVFSGLTLGSLSGVLKASAGVISGSSTTDDLPEGKTNVYYTDARSRSAISGGTGISYNNSTGVITNTAPVISSITGTTNQIIVTGSTSVTLSTPQDIGTGSSVQFARLINSSIGSTNLLLGTSTGSNLTSGGGCIFIGQGSGNCVTSGTQNIGIGLSTYGGGGTMTQNSAQNIAIGNNALFSATTTANNNVACGYQALQTLTDGNNNSAFGYQAGQAVVGGIRNTLIGNSAGYSISSGSFNTLVGASPSFILTTGQFNTCLGYIAGQSLITGSYNLHLGYNTQASSSSVSNEIVIGSNSTITQGRGANTAFINSSAGLYAYTPGYWYGTAQYVVGGIFRWTTTINRAIALKVGDDTQVLCPVAGIYEFTMSGSIYSNLITNQNVSMFVNGSAYISAPCNYSGLVGWRAIALSVIVNVTTPNTYIQYTMSAGIESSATFPTVLTVKYLGL